MTKKAKTRWEIVEWHEEFQRLSYDWSVWLQANTVNYESIREAWMAYTAQWQGNYNPIPEVETWLEE